MKALSLRQPWAWMVVHGPKDIENRRWLTHFRGSFLIHAASAMKQIEYDQAVAFARLVAPSIEVPAFSELVRGGIIGRASLVDVIPPCGETFCGHPWHMPAQYGWRLADREPVPFDALPGSLSFFDPEKMRDPRWVAPRPP